MRFLFTAAFALLFFSVSFASSNAHACGAVVAGLSESQTAVLAESAAATDHYTITILHGAVDGVPRTIVLLGEVHLKTEVEKVIGQRIVAEFPEIGREGIDLKKYWASRAVEKAVKFLYRMARFSMGKERTAAQSTLQDVASRAQGDHLLEGKFVPTRGENIALLTLPLVTLGVTAMPFVGLAGTVVGTFGESIGLGPVTSKVLSWGGAAMVVLWSPAMSLAMRFANYATAMHRRNGIMVAEIGELLRQNASLKTLLVVVGKDHVSGMQTLLETNLAMHVVEMPAKESEDAR